MPSVPRGRGIDNPRSGFDLLTDRVHRIFWWAMLKAIAICSEPKGCPLYKDEDQLAFSPPNVEGIKHVPVCGIAVSKLYDRAVAITQGAPAGEHVGVTCGGCEAGEAWWDFVVRDEKESTLPPNVLKVLEKMPIFQDVTPDHLAKILRLMQDYRAEAGQDLITGGTSVEVFFILLAGAVQVVVPDPAGEKVVATLGAGECFGEMGLLTGATASATVRAAKDSALLAVGREDFKSMVKVAPEIGFNFAKIIAGRLAKADKRLSEALKQG